MTGFNTQLSAECISLLNLVMALSSLVQLTQLSHWVDVCFVLWRCRPHRIFMWETQTMCVFFIY